MNAVAREDLGPAIVATDRNGDDERTPWMTESFVDVGLQIESRCDLVELLERRPEDFGVEFGLPGHEITLDTRVRSTAESDRNGRRPKSSGIISQ
jgi:hypothetical protein